MDEAEGPRVSGEDGGDGIRDPARISARDLQARAVSDGEEVGVDEQGRPSGVSGCAAEPGPKI